MTDFFEAQEHARKQTRLLVFLFGVAVVAIIGAVYLAVTAGNAYATGEARFDPGTLVMVALFTGLMIGGGSAFRISSLRQGGGKVARMLGGREVPADTTDLAERRLLNVVEEMAVASGTPVPEVYVMDREEGINAFAAGYSIHDAAVAVTRGTLDTLTRDELQGVIAHEFSHIMNGDMRLNIRLIGLLHGILLLAIVGRGILYTGGRGGGRGRGGGGGAGQIAILGIVLLLVGYIGVIFGKLIKAAISRQREYLADSSAVQFTRNPDGIAGALKKIGSQGSRIRDHHAEEASHMFFASGLKLSFGSVLATHPPLEKRIRRIDPTWDGDFAAEPRPESAAAEAARQAERLRKEREAAKPDGIELAGAGAMIMASIGAPKGEHIRFAAALLRSMPEELRDAVHHPLGARAVVYALLLHGPDEVLATQRDILETDDPQLAQPTRDIEETVAAAGAEARLPLLDLALPALRRLSPDEASRFRSTVHRLIQADGKVRTFDYAVVHILDRHLADREPKDRRPKRPVNSFEPLRTETEIVLSAIARAGADDEEAALAAFRSGTADLPRSKQELRLLPEAETGLTEVDEALTGLERSSFEIRRKLLQAALGIVMHDGVLRGPEGELVRAVCESLDVPMPPLAAGMGAAKAAARPA